MKIVDLSLSIAPPLVLVCLLGVFFRRATYRDFPVFFAYMWYVLLAAVLRGFAARRPSTYFWLYWGTEGIYGIAEVLVIREVFHRIFSFSHAQHRFVRRLLPITVVVILALTLWQTIFHPLGHGIPWEVNAIYWFDFGVHLLEGTILVLLVLLTLSRVFALNWQQYEFGILAGFGVAANATLLSYLFRFEFGAEYERFFRYGPPAGYILATLIWLHAFLRSPKEQPQARMDIDDLLARIERANQFLRNLGKRLWRREKQTSPLMTLMGTDLH